METVPKIRSGVLVYGTAYSGTYTKHGSRWQLLHACSHAPPASLSQY